MVCSVFNIASTYPIISTYSNMLQGGRPVHAGQHGGPGAQHGGTTTATTTTTTSTTTTTTTTTDYYYYCY